jgi:hypothetical protein
MSIPDFLRIPDARPTKWMARIPLVVRDSKGHRFLVHGMRDILIPGMPIDGLPVGGFFPVALDRYHVSFLRWTVEILSLFRDLRGPDSYNPENLDSPTADIPMAPPLIGNSSSYSRANPHATSCRSDGCR